MKEAGGCCIPKECRITLDWESRQLIPIPGLQSPNEKWVVNGAKVSRCTESSGLPAPMSDPLC